MERKFGVIIISHGRAGRVHTLNTLRKEGYTGNYIILIDDEDESGDEYRRIYGEDHIKVFSKNEIEKRIDTFDHFKNRGVTVYARNACWDAAKEMGWTHYLELDDDYVGFRTRFEDGNELRAKHIRDLDSVIEAYLDFLDTSGALTVAWAQAGDFIGGIAAFIWKHRYKRKAMNAFFCRTDRPFEFMGRMNDDVNMYCIYGQKGEFIITPCDVVLNQIATQQNKGGMTEAYLDTGTYLKSFYSVICAPSCVKIFAMPTANTRIHHIVTWENCCPKVMSSNFKK